MTEHYRFRFEAMATVFELTIGQAGVDAKQARAAADSVFSEIGYLEEQLSRFRPTSDIWRIGMLKAGESTSVGLAAWDCLSLSKAVHTETGGAFDITIGPLMRLWRNPDGTPRQPGEQELAAARACVGSHLFDLDPDGLRVSVRADCMLFDLGAVGKGYALDQAVQTLADWEVHNAVLNSGDSTVLAIGAPPGDRAWVVTVGGHTLSLKDRAISGSGFAVKGAHIMNPRTFSPAPVRPERTYASAPTAAMSDALSTAFMIMEPGEIEELCRKHPEIEVITG